jgi:hypothetical protein
MPALCIEDQLQEMAKLRPVLVDGTAVAYFRNRLRISYRRRRSSQKTRGAPGAPRSKDLSREASFASFTSSKLTVAAVNPNPPQVAGAKALPKDWPFPAGTMRSARSGGGGCAAGRCSRARLPAARRRGRAREPPQISLYSQAPHLPSSPLVSRNALKMGGFAVDLGQGSPADISRMNRQKSAGINVAEGQCLHARSQDCVTSQVARNGSSSKFNPPRAGIWCMGCLGPPVESRRARPKLRRGGGNRLTPPQGKQGSGCRGCD